MSLYEKEQEMKKLINDAHESASHINNAKAKIGFSNLLEAYTNLFEGMPSAASNLQKIQQSASRANEFKKQAGDSARTAGESEGDASTSASNAKFSQEQSENSAEDSCNSSYQSALQEWNAEDSRIEAEWQEAHAKYGRTSIALEHAASDAILNSNKELRQVNNAAEFNAGGGAMKKPEAILNYRENTGENQRIKSKTDNTLQNIENQQKNVERNFQQTKQAIINKYRTHKFTNKPVQPNCSEQSVQAGFTNYNRRASYEGYSNIEGFKEGASFTLSEAGEQDINNYPRFKKSVHNLIDNKIVDKAVQENNFKNDLVLSYLSDNDYSKTDLKKIYDSEEQKNNLNKRKNNILKYENNVFKQYTHILKVIVIVLLLIAPILMLNKKEIINYTITKYLIITLFLLVFMYIIKILYDINSRDSINFNKYKLDDGKYRRLQEQGKISRKGRLSSTFGGTCIGSECCDDGMTYDANIDKCIYTEIGAELTIISKIDAAGQFKIKSNKSGTLTLNSDSLLDPSISVGDNTLQISSYDSTKDYTGTFTPYDGTGIVNIDIPKRPS